MSFYDNYLYLCRAKAISPSAAAVKMGFNKSTVTRWKNGGSPSNENLHVIAKYFNVPIDSLFDEKEKPTPISESELDNSIVEKLLQLTPSEIKKVDAFVAGLIAARQV